MTIFGAPTPILRSFDEAKAREFYVDFLGFEVTFEHRFEPDLPLYMGLRLGETELHLSEHHGDCSPGARIRIETTGLEAFAATLRARTYANARPGCPERQPWGELDLTIADPFGNRLTFYEPVEPTPPETAA